MDFNNNYLNKSQNKDLRNDPKRKETHGTVEFVVWHGTDSPNPTNTPATLDWALINDGKRGAANYYIAQSGETYHYIDETSFIAWHAGAGGARYRGHIGYQVNVFSIGIELEERITKRPKIPATPRSLESAAQLALQIKRLHGIPLDRPYHVGHKEIVNPGYRSDPDSYSIDLILNKAKVIEMTTQPTSTTVDSRFGQAWAASGGIWQPGRLTPGFPKGDPFEYQGRLHQLFERGVARLETDGKTSWLLYHEVIQMAKDLGISL